MNTVLDILNEAKKKKKVVTPPKKKVKIVYVGNANKYGISEFRNAKLDRHIYNEYTHGLRDKTNKKTILKPQYRIDDSRRNYYWLVSRPYHKFALFSPKGKKITDFIYSSVWSISNKFVALKENNTWIICDANGKKALPNGYDDVDILDHPKSLSLVKEDGTTEHRDLNTLKILSIAYDEVLQDLTKDVLIVSKDDQIGMYNKKTGNMILSTNYSDDYETIEIGKQIYVVLSLGNREGMVDVNGSIIIPFNYAEVDQYDITAFKGDHLIKVVMPVNSDENLFSLKHHRSILSASYDELEIGTKKGFLYIAGSVSDKKQCGVVKYDGNKTTTILPNVFSNVEMDLDYNEIDASFDNNNHTYSFDLDGRPKGEVNKKLIRDIFRYIK